jgi:hypothetical protein
MGAARAKTNDTSVRGEREGKRCEEASEWKEVKGMEENT